MIGTTELNRILGFEYSTNRLWRWRKRGLLIPTVSPSGSGSRALWSPADVLRALVLDTVTRLEPENGSKKLLSIALADWWNPQPAESAYWLSTADLLVVSPGRVVTGGYGDLPGLVGESGAVTVVKLDPLRQRLIKAGGAIPTVSPLGPGITGYVVDDGVPPTEGELRASEELRQQSPRGD